MKEKYILPVLLGAFTLLLVGCVEPVLRFSWRSMEIHVLNYTDNDVEITVSLKNGAPIIKSVPPSEIPMVREDFKIALNDTDALTEQEYLKLFFLREYPFDEYNIGIKKAVQIGGTYSYSRDQRPVYIEATQNNNVLYESNVYMDTYINEVLLTAPSGTTPNIYSVIPFDRTKTEEMYIYWIDQEGSTVFYEEGKEALIKCYIGIFPAE